tara:strand:+ start:60 stop:167 length:108 start_codon:yes stop_codon:yes gene_type:complete
MVGGVKALYAILLALVLMDIVFSSNTIELINYPIN